MTRPADWAVARAFWEARLIQSSFQTGADFADWVIDAAAIDEAEPGGADRESEEVMQIERRGLPETQPPVASAADGKAAAPYGAEAPIGYFDQLSKEVKTWPVLDESTRADFPSLLDGIDPPYDRCPTCTAHMPVGKICGGAACGLRGK